MKRALKIVSRKRNMSRPEPLKLTSELAQRDSPFEQGIAHLEKDQSTLKTINELVLTMSHYLNAPLTVLLGRVELLSQLNQNGGASKEEVDKFVSACKREILRIDAIVKGFQDLCQVQHKVYPPGVKMLDVEKEVRNRVDKVSFLR